MERINKILTIIKDLNCDCAVITDRANVRYLSGFSGSAGYLVISEKERLLVTDFRYVEQAEKQAKNFQIKNSADFKIAEYARDFENAAFEDTTISYSKYLWLSKMFKNLTPLGNAVIKLRSIKDKYEIENIRTAEKIGDEAFSHILSFIKEGMTESRVAREIEFYMLSNGAQKLSFDTIVATGANGSLPHAQPGESILKKGDLVVMDFGCVYNGYCSDMTRTVGIGSLDSESIDAYNTVLKAQLAALDTIKAGVTGAKVHNTAFDIIDSSYMGMFGHSLGHGLGL